MAYITTKFLIVDDDIDDVDLFCEALEGIDANLECKTINRGDRRALLV